MQWQPVESAPKDGTEIMYWCQMFGKPMIARYKDGHIWSGSIASQPSAIPREWSDITQFWMPLPKAPADEA